MAGAPTRLRLGLTVATDGTGAGSTALSLHQSLWVIAYLVISGSAGAPAWTLTVGGSVVATSSGSSALLGPIVVPPAAQVTVATITGAPNTTYSGSFEGQGWEDPDDLPFVTPAAPAGTTVATGTVTANQGAPGAQAWPVSAASLPLPTGAATEATLAGRLKPADTLAAVGAVTAITNALPAGTNRIGSVRPVDSADADLTAVKGTQTTRGIGTQDFKDSGRQQVLLSWEEMAGTAAAESALTNFTFGTLNAGALGAATSYTVSTGKRLRIQSVTLYLKSTSTAEILARYRIRQAASGIANNSPPIFDAVMALDAATVAATQGDQLAIPIPDGLEVAAGQQITFTWFTSANTCTVGMSITGYEY